MLQCVASTYVECAYIHICNLYLNAVISSELDTAIILRNMGGCCSVLQSGEVYCSTLPCILVSCSVLQCLAVSCSVVQNLIP